CHPNPSFLHDGRARSIEEAILWHGGEGLASKEAYSILSNDEKSAVLEFLNSL
ncbi:di-heme oxidoredictase family protein, partial [Vibrio sp. 10N.222.54.F6]